MNAVMILLLFSVGMFAIPLSGYYFSKTYILEGEQFFGVKKKKKLTYS